METSEGIRCPDCDAPLTIDAILAAPLADTGRLSLFWTPCPACGKALEMRVSADVLEIGMTYWAGSMHFEALHRITVPGLRLIDGVLYRGSKPL